MSVKRIFAEKKEGFNVEAQRLLAEFKSNFGVTALRILNRYDVEGIADEDFPNAVDNVFSEKVADIVYYDDIDIPKGYTAFAVEYLPGQYDQRADSAAACVQLLTKKERPLVRYAKVYLVKGAKDLTPLKTYVINPVDSHEATLDKYQTLNLNLQPPKKVEVVEGFTKFSKKQIEEYVKDKGYAMTTEDMLFAQNYFKTEKKDPTITELKVLDTYWSDHCRHTTFLTKLNNIEFEDDDLCDMAQNAYRDYLSAKERIGSKKDITLMDIATMYPKEAKLAGKVADESEEINACSINHKINTNEGELNYLIMFKNETHNHPTEIEPFGGAATCLGGAIRDPLSGRSYVYQAMRVTGSGDPTLPLSQTMEYKLPQRKITREAAHGYSSYGNQIGLATGQVSELYHSGYTAKRLEIGAVIGATPKENVIRLTPMPDDIVVLIGGRTGRDGCGGATGSSKEHDESSTSTCGAEVQKGNPLTERKLQRLFRNGKFSRLIKRCNDFGAGGVCVAIGELAEGLEINLSAVPKKYEGLDGTELAISESQERMAVVINPLNLQEVLAYCDEENLEATVVAKVTKEKRLKMFLNREKIVDISREFLDSNGATQTADVLVCNSDTKDMFKEQLQSTPKETLFSLLSDLNICSQKGLQEMFDSTIGASSITMPLGGKHQLTPIDAMCALVPCEPHITTTTATLMSYGCDPYLLSKSPFAGAVYSVLMSVAKIVASGGALKDIWLTFQEYFERLREDKRRWGKPFSALLGAYLAQKELNIVAIGGKDSMSGSFLDIDVPPTLCSFALSPVEAQNVITNEFKAQDSKLYLLDIKRDHNGIPVFSDVIAKYNHLTTLIAQGKVLSAKVVDRGGILCALTKSAFGNSTGFKLYGDDIEYTTAKLYGAIIVESKGLDSEHLTQIGETTKKPVLEFCGEKVRLEDALKVYTKPLEQVFPTITTQKGETALPLYTKKNIQICKYKTAVPRVVIPVFAGTNCEYDTARAFIKAGAIPRIVVMRNLTPTAIEESIRNLQSEISNAQIIMLPGGFSLGDEPEGSGKFIATTFRNPRIKNATLELLNHKDGLMLGICNGFQALIKLGLVPYGDILDMDADCPTLTYNSIGRHISCIADTKIISANSPWLAQVKPGDIHKVALSHGEGRFVASQAVIEELAKNGQIATQYVDLEGNPSLDTSVTPNGSMYGIEGILSKDGRVFGKMGHTERSGEYNFKNVEGDYNQKIFESGVAYFR